MQLARKSSHSSFYESFSDLIFCALVLFVALVMVLATNVGEQVESLKQAQTDLVGTKKNLESSKEQLRAVVNSRRYTGSSGVPKLNVAIGFVTNEPKVYFVPQDAMFTLTTPVIKETEEDAIRRQRSAMQEITASVDLQPGLTLGEYQSFLKAFSYQAMYLRETPYLGIKIVEDDEGATKISEVLPVSNVSPDDAGAVILQVDGAAANSVDFVIKRVAAHDESNPNVQLQLKNHGRIYERTARVLFHEYSGINQVTISMANQIASGYRLKGDQLDLEKDGSGEDFQDQAIFEVVEKADELFSTFGTFPLGPTTSAEPVTVLRVGIVSADQSFVVGGVRFGTQPMLELLRAIGGGTVALEFQDERAQTVQEIPAWVHQQLLAPSGYVHQAPDVSKIKDWLKESDAGVPASAGS